jgi:hypothetical protein
MNTAIEAAERKVAAIDKRINLVRAEMCRMAGLDVDAFDYETKEGQMVACQAFTVARRDFNGYDGIEQALYSRRYDASKLVDKLVAKQARADELREAREYRKAHVAKHCPTCGQAVAA